MELIIEERVEDMEEEIEFLQSKQKGITEKILRYARYGH